MLLNLKPFRVLTTLSPLFFIFLLILSDSPILIHAPDTYTVFTVAGASGSVAKTIIYEDYAYVYNNTYILIYDLATQTTSSNISLGGSVSVTTMIKKGNELYLEVNDGGATKYRVYHLTNDTLMDEITDIGLTNFDGDLRNLAWCRNNNIDFWGWSYVSGSYLDTEQYSTFKGWDSSNDVRFISSVTGQGQDDETYTHYFYRLNTSDSDVSSVTDTMTWASPNYVTFGNYFTATMTPAKDDEASTQIIYSSNTYKYGYLTTSRNIQSIQSGFNSYYSVYKHGIRETTNDMTFIYDNIASDVKGVWVDVEDTVYLLQNNDDNRVIGQAFTALGTGSTSNIYLTYDTHIDSMSYGVLAIDKYLDNMLSESTFVGYVRDTIRPYAEKLIGTTPTVVGSLPTEYTPTACYVYPSDTNMVAVFTQSGSTSLYICIDLIETQYLGNDYTTTNQIIGQLYRCYVSSGSFVYQIRFYANDTQQTRMNGETAYFYIDGSYERDITLNSDGVASLSHSSPTQAELSFYINATYYQSAWLNITLYSITPTLTFDISTTEQPRLSLTATDNTDTNTLIIRLTVLRQTLEDWTDYYHVHAPQVYTQIETIGDNYYDVDYWSAMEVNEEAQIRASLGYSEEYSYRITYFVLTTDQTGYMANITANAQASLSYDGETGEITIGQYVSLPSAPSTQSQWETETVNPNTLLLLTQLATDNMGFMVMLGLVIAIVIGLARINGQSAIIGMFALLGMVLGFGGYTGLLPLPIFIVTAVALSLGLALVLSKMFGGSDRT